MSENKQAKKVNKKSEIETKKKSSVGEKETANKKIANKKKPSAKFSKLSFLKSGFSKINFSGIKGFFFKIKDFFVNVFNNLFVERKFFDKGKFFQKRKIIKDGVEIIDADALLRKAKQEQKDKLRMTTGKNPVWLIPTMCGLMILGLLWIVIFYLTASETSLGLPIPIGNWNLLIGLVFIMVGFGLTTMWK
jgi:hypothetical protein